MFMKFTFDENNPNWTPTNEYNLMFVRSQINFLMQRLRARGNLTLNEALESFGIEPCREGLTLGWIFDKHVEEPEFISARSNIRSSDGVVLNFSGLVDVTESFNTAVNLENSPEEEFHDVLMVAFDVRGPNAKTVHKWLQSQMPDCCDHLAPYPYHGVINLDSWWVANDERFDRSDQDSAVFVPMGQQEECRELLAKNDFRLPKDENMSYAVQDISFTSREQALRVSDRLNKLIDAYGQVTVGDFYNLCGLPYSYRDDRFGWANATFEVVRSDSEFSIEMPRPKRLTADEPQTPDFRLPKDESESYLVRDNAALRVTVRTSHFL